MSKKRKNESSKSKSAVKTPNQKLTKTLVENLVELQKIHVNLAEKFDNYLLCYLYLKWQHKASQSIQG